MRKFAGMICLLCSGGIAVAHPPGIGAGAVKNPAQGWDSLVDEYFEQVRFKFAPTEGTADGLHQYDSLLEDYSRKGVDAEVAALHEFEKRIGAVDPKSLDRNQAIDQEMLLSSIRGALLTLETVRPWEKNPDNYSSGISNSVYVLMSRRFAPPDERLRSAIAREKLMPAVFAAARQNLKNPPRVYTEIALEQIPGLVAFFQNDVPAAFADAKDASVKTEFAKSNAAVISELQNYQQWLKTDLLPRSNGDFRLGADTFSKKLLYDEMVDIPLDRLLEVGRADLRKNQDEFKRIAKELEPNKTAREVLGELDADHPKPDHLLQAFRDTFNGLIGFIREKHIITIPSEVRPILEETPPFERATTFASMDTPGPFEKIATEAYFNVTLPAAGDTPEQIEGRMAGFNVGTIISTAVHEAYPGHYVQFLWVGSAPSKVRKLIGAASNSEGWAHYCEQMMLDEGFGQPGVGAKDVRESRLIRLGQLQDALLRNARFVVGIEMHRGTMSFDQAVDFFVKEGYQSKEVGLVETKRGTADATYLYYTLGKLEILKLREDMKRKEGAAFSLEAFHNNFMRQGFPPIKIVRRIMLGDDSPAL
ncbi:MAG TPA: DUF885 domain-containing protein [Candidatus Angelobacter sp.]|nr:DUF885 domain-containing protein [Candidatus Angelobacter sp.]